MHKIGKLLKCDCIIQLINMIYDYDSLFIYHIYCLLIKQPEPNILTTCIVIVCLFVTC